MRIGMKRMLAALRWRREFAMEERRKDRGMELYWSGYLQAIGSVESFLRGCADGRF